ncbi:MAG: isoprenoid biosynthesis glyoxalase ElbB, partial [Spirochaetota bacterium]|nr:isoprenoid biosynthesis glyoxalase ElbB [Spirochaetota bacterium]
MAKVGVVLSGCGVYDGSEIHEAVLTLLALDKRGADVICMAPNVDQLHVINHLKGEPVEGESRNVLIESARIARGNVRDMKDVSATELDAIIFPGGFGGAKNLSDFAVKGADCTVNPEVDRIINEMHSANKPIAMVCITPVITSKVFQKKGQTVKLTIGDDKDTYDPMIAMGTNHIICPVTDIVVDEENKIISSPAYMY